jgi:hypothetical protein
MNSPTDIQAAALLAVRKFFSHKLDIATLEQEIADLWVANDRELDGALGDIYHVVTDWNHKYTFRETVEQLREIFAAHGAPPN